MEGTPSNSVIVTRALTKHYGSVEALTALTLDVREGEIFGFLGPNGAGKSTTIDMMLGLLPPDAGRVTLFGMEPQAAVEAGAVGAMLQTGGLIMDLTVREVVTRIMGQFRDQGILQYRGRRLEILDRDALAREAIVR